MEANHSTRSKPRKTESIPSRVARFFWDCDPSALSLRRHRNFIIRRVLDQGDWEAILWLRRQFGDEAIREWFLRTSGRGLDPRTLRLWALILRLPTKQVDAWVARERAGTWYRRTAR